MNGRKVRERTGDVAADNGLDGEDGRLLDEDGAALELVAVLLDLGGHLVDAGGEDVVRNVLGVGVVGEVVEEEEGIVVWLTYSIHCTHIGGLSTYP